ncbi:MAG: class II aldolase/adducin family protein [Rectinemataceae bacterium]
MHRKEGTIMDRIAEASIMADVCEIGRRMYGREYVSANDGNISVRLGPDRILTTPTLVSKGFMTPEMLVVVDMDGAVVEGNRRPSSELKMHLKVYRERADVNAVVHAHPETATAFAVLGVALDKAYMPEHVVSLGAVPVAAYATPGTDEVPDSIAPFLHDHNAVLLSNHGVLTWGRDLLEAYFRLETVEAYAKIVRAAMSMGEPRFVPADKMDALVRTRESLGVHSRLPSFRKD